MDLFLGSLFCSISLCVSFKWGLGKIFLIRQLEEAHWTEKDRMFQMSRKEGVRARNREEAKQNALHERRAGDKEVLRSIVVE